MAGDWHVDSETMPLPNRPYLMRVMLVANVAVDMRFANGTQGRLLHWFPDSVARGKALSAGHPELLMRFAKELLAFGRFEMPIMFSKHCFLIFALANEESSMMKKEMLPEVDHIDVTSRMESIGAAGIDAVLLQVPIVPCNALTIHKVQARFL